MAVDAFLNHLHLFPESFAGKPDGEVKRFCNRDRNNLAGTFSAEELPDKLRISDGCRDADSLEVAGKFVNPL